MHKDPNWPFALSVSRQNYSHKPSREDGWYKTIHFEPQQLTATTLLGNALQGKVFCHCFQGNSTNSFSGMPKKEDFQLTSTLFYDIDNSDIPLKEYIDKLSFRPSVAYTTFSNGEKGYRFRLIFLFSKPIVGVDEYDVMYNAVAAANGFANLDKLPCSQVYFGTNSSAECFKSDYVYSGCEFDNFKIGAASATQETTNTRVIKDTTTSITINGDILNDIRKMKFDDFLHKYAHLYYDNYKASLESPLILDESKMFFRFPDEYYAVKHKTCKGKTLRWEDGEGRRKKLFYAGEIMLNNLDGLTAENLLFNLVCEREWFYMNNDGVLSNELLVDFTRNAYIYKYQLIQSKHPSFRVNKPFWEEQGKTARQAVNHIRGYLKALQVKRYYNPYISYNENVEMLKDKGIKVSVRTLQRMVASGDIPRQTLPPHPFIQECRSSVTNSIIDLIKENGSITQSQISKQLSIDIRTVKRHFKDMQGKLITREGNNRTGRWIALPQEHEERTD